VGPVLREYLISEAMHALGIPTTRTLAAVATGETVRRDRPLPGAVLTRTAASHVRVGTFQFFAARKTPTPCSAWPAYVVDRHCPEAAQQPNPALALLHAVIERQAALIAQWMGVGFVHGVMNTDNMTVSGETIDYGPCAFMEAHDPDTVFSSIDHQGRYAYGNQPGIGQWNLARFAETLLPSGRHHRPLHRPAGAGRLHPSAPQRLHRRLPHILRHLKIRHLRLLPMRPVRTSPPRFKPGYLRPRPLQPPSRTTKTPFRQRR
jgi:uncharacterized protein YdiU (UPF0061 family)